MISILSRRQHLILTLSSRTNSYLIWSVIGFVVYTQINIVRGKKGILQLSTSFEKVQMVLQIYLC